MTRRLDPGEWSEPFHIDWRDAARLAGLSPAQRDKRSRGKRWQVRVEYGDAQGRRREVSASGDTKSAASRALDRKIALIKQSMWATTDLDASSTVAAIARHWMAERREAADARPQTLSRYQVQLDCTVLPTWGYVPIGDLTAPRIRAGLRATEQKKRSRPARQVLSMVIRHAIAIGAITTNPLDGLRAEKPKAMAAPRSLTDEEIRAVIGAVARWEAPREGGGARPTGTLGLLVALMLETGCRIGEALAVRRCDLHLRDAEPWLTIGGTLVEPSRGGADRLHRQGFTKGDETGTDDPGRDIAISTSLAQRFEDHLRRWPQPNVAGPVLANRRGYWLWPSNVRASLRRALAAHASDVLDVHPHLFRSTVATLVSRDEGPEAAQRLLGHSSLTTTKRYYIEQERTVIRPGITLDRWRSEGAAGS